MLSCLHPSVLPCPAPPQTLLKTGTVSGSPFRNVFESSHLPYMTVCIAAGNETIQFALSQAKLIKILDKSEIMRRLIIIFTNFVKAISVPGFCLYLEAHRDRVVCSHSLMDRISDSGSDGLGSNPDGSTFFTILRCSVAHGG